MHDETNYNYTFDLYNIDRYTGILTLYIIQGKLLKGINSPQIAFEIIIIAFNLM